MFWLCILCLTSYVQVMSAANRLTASYEQRLRSAPRAKELEDVKMVVQDLSAGYIVSIIRRARMQPSWPNTPFWYLVCSKSRRVKTT